MNGKDRETLDKVVLFPYKGARHFVLSSGIWKGRRALLQMLLLGWLPALKYLYKLNN